MPACGRPTRSGAYAEGVSMSRFCWAFAFVLAAPLSAAVGQEPLAGEVYRGTIIKLTVPKDEHMSVHVFLRAEAPLGEVEFWIPPAVPIGGLRSRDELKKGTRLRVVCDKEADATRVDVD
jgi:hypothetical protein